MRRGLLVAAAAGLAGSCFAGAAGSPSSRALAASEGPAVVLSGLIVFDNDARDIWRVDADGSHLRQLTHSNALEFDPEWSPDGRRIVYRSETEGNSEIFVMNADGTGAVNLTRNPAEDYSPSWSPDGERIAFASSRSGVFNDIYVMSIDGSNVHRVTRSVSVDEYPSWSPDGRRIVFTSSRTGHWDLFVINADGTGTRRITRRGGKSPSWSPRTGLIAYQGPDGSSGSDRHMSSLWVVRANGRKAHRVIRNANTPTWAPNGSLLLIARAGTGLTAVDLTGKVRAVITPPPALNADWSAILRNPGISPTGGRRHAWSATSTHSPRRCGSTAATASSPATGRRARTSSSARTSAST